MQISDEQKKKNDETRKNRLGIAFNSLLTSPVGLTAKEVADRIKVKDVRLVREIIREALAEAEKKKLVVKRERIPNKATKIYNIIDPTKPTPAKAVEPPKKTL